MIIKAATYYFFIFSLFNLIKNVIKIITKTDFSLTLTFDDKELKVLELFNSILSIYVLSHFI